MPYWLPDNEVLPRCANCNRPMYRDSADLDAIKPLYPFRLPDGRDVSQLGAVDWSGLNHDYGWRSVWTPTLCRQCDTEHDHRKRPSLWYRLTRRG